MLRFALTIQEETNDMRAALPPSRLLLLPTLVVQADRRIVANVSRIQATEGRLVSAEQGAASLNLTIMVLGTTPEDERDLGVEGGG